MLDNSLPNMKIRPIANYQLPIANYFGASGNYSTTVESALQIAPFLTNKANFNGKNSKKPIFLDTFCP
jgi:hypothetical protein